MRSKKGKINETLREEYLRTRSAARETRIQEARRRSEQDIGASPELHRSQTTAASPPGGGGEEREETEQYTMSDDFQKFVAKVDKKLDALPTGEQFENMGLNIKKNAEEIATNAAKIASNTDRIEEHEKTIESLRSAMGKQEQDQIAMNRGIEARIRGAAAEDGHGRHGGSRPEYAESRTSLRVWPIEGKSMTEIKSNCEEFFTNALGVDDLEQEVGQFQARRAQGQKDSTVFSEVIVKFRDPTTRDRIASKGPRLSPFIDEKGRPTCGMRMDVPGFLLPTFRLLRRCGFHMKKNGEIVKHAVRFDDYEESIFLQVKHDSEGEWINIYPDEAHKHLRSADANRYAELSSRPKSASSQSIRNVRRTTESKRASASASAAGKRVHESEMEVSDGEQEVFLVDQQPAWKPSKRPKNT